ncbi:MULTISPECIES: succinate dehydrogenase/fumarate reductase iron-sulfur subunit [Haloarcula]|uniref:Succinate dehydrogenase iron-sulfur protein subunit n=1 Tax=Haloarcula marismortui (strain ATCC 43049 / DSM 3752 / JCM 8966 / VKM B-1809) TaxID=272569 RepID=Q5V347_HALMA|nr:MULTISPECIES: succinate dehydrogenase/fumarate reductase iron-sulfur subunit [Haloarcula]AAV46055.1 succinate dehydrogenase iron-sulfur protein subunit [Haloarcula marismortui ATCC 43049]NHN65249.1 succinate dehydrogenase/fumarate reductase iron-sulfur subunit [Haloarcula sp. JP-Z28]NHX38136.1 succinate dehydrogenase/fumarate reductase iron-sulfur subunit [Haloarcula sp. R1-2]QCP90819.1 succinate dehydrogenase/fumarate reductase iron-sulfur subunit [Haloarcula marismortui ATCC 43049]
MSTQIEQQETETEADEETEPEVESPGDRRRAQRDERQAQEQAQREVEEETLDDDDTITLKVFRYDPEVEGKQEPRFDDFRVPFHKGMTILDALIYARDHYDSSLTFRHSCRQAVCGSDALFVNGRQRLGCKTQISELEDPVRIEPLPHQEVVKDLVVDMEHFYDQMEAVEPYFDADETPDDKLEEQRQTRENREKVKMSTRCIWCGACMSSCNIAAGDNEYLGPAAINKAYRFAMDEREGENRKQERLRIIEQEHGVWRCQTQFSCTEVCPKDIPLTEHIQELKREAVKNNLKFW